MTTTDEALKRLATFAAAEGVPWLDTPENLAALQADIRDLLTLVKTPAESERLEAALIEERAMTRYSCEPGNLDWHEEVERVHVFYREKARAELVADGLLYDAEKGATDDDNG